MKKTVPALAALVLGAVGSAVAQEAGDVTEGIFSEEQVARGQELYEQNCVVCHGEELTPSDAEIPTLTAPAFRWSWQGKTIGEKFQRIHDTMPPSDPASLTDQQYVDIVTYILHFNGYPTGDQELEADTERLNALVIEPLE